ncbi:MAG: DUF429 domain-containing protein [Pseudomonadota bacterium]
MNATIDPEPLPRIVAGADGCRAGWVIACQNLASNKIGWDVVPCLRDFLHRPAVPVVLAIDIPIGLPERGSRECDLEARRMLKRPRSSSVFPAPIRSLLAAESYREASARRFRLEGKRVSIQSWNIVPKVREVDLLLLENAALRSIIRESHPELCFFAMAGGSAMVHAKKSPAGRRERELLLRRQFGDSVGDALADRTRLKCAADDILDAFSVLWTARRIHKGEAVTVPRNPGVDACGLPMEIVV